jgi:RNA polymerase sigma factor (sigma-70 family)
VPQRATGRKAAEQRLCSRDGRGRVLLRESSKFFSVRERRDADAACRRNPLVKYDDGADNRWTAGEPGPAAAPNPAMRRPPDPTDAQDPDVTEPEEPNQAADAELVLRSRSGDRQAFAELWRRHYRSGVTVARTISPAADPDDLVQEAYTRIFHAVQRGGGPTGSFRAYLFTSIRNTAADWGRSRHETTIDELETLEDPSSTEQATADSLDRSLTHQAFRSLPSRWQEVLWYSEIEGMKPAQIAPLLGLKPTAVAQLAFRAREGLREAWVQAHLRSVADDSECAWAIARLGAYARENLARRDRPRLERHLRSCTRCMIVASEAQEVSSRLALVLIPLTIGAAGAAGYLASLQTGAPAIALTAMPSAVVEGAATAAGPGAAGAAASGTAVSSGLAAGSVAAGTAVTAGATGAAGGRAHRRRGPGRRRCSDRRVGRRRSRAPAGRERGIRHSRCRGGGDPHPRRGGRERRRARDRTVAFAVGHPDAE